MENALHRPSRVRRSSEDFFLLYTTEIAETVTYQAPRLLIAGTHSGCGKTTVTLALTQALTSRGLRVQPFKTGPDYLDSGHLAALAGRPCRNLDTWMLSREAVREVFLRGASQADLSLVEGVMGLHDGRVGEGRTASTAEVAAELKIPVLLVLDVSGMGRSAAALVSGYADFDPDVKIQGVVLNRVGSERHARIISDELRTRGMPVLGWLLKDPRLALPERYLGLVTARESSLEPGLTQMSAQSGSHIDLEQILAIARGAPPLDTSVPPARPAQSPVVVAYALDDAFQFYYEEGLEALRQAGADLVPFRPLTDARLPAGTQALYIGGGYPELRARELEQNTSLRWEIREFSDSGHPVYAECGGLMYLMEGLLDPEGKEHRMVGVFPGRTRMGKQRRALGYCTVRTRKESTFLPADLEVRAHEYHYSRLEDASGEYVYDVRKTPQDAPTPDGLLRHRTLASYVHMDFAGIPLMAERLVEAART